MINVRELPPLRQHILATTPNGNTYRWAEDERRAENNFSGLSYSTVMPGGDENFDCVLPRKTGINYQDLVRLSSIRVLGVGGACAGEYRLEKTPRVSGDQVSVSPQAVGHQAHLEDDPEAVEVYVDRDLSHWAGASRARKIGLYSTLNFETVEDPSVDADATSGIPALNLKFTGSGGAMDGICEAWYDGGAGVGIASIYVDWTSTSTEATYTGVIGSASDANATTTSLSSDMLTGTNSSGTATQTNSPATYRYGLASMFASGITPLEADHVLQLRRITVWGNHTLPKQGTAPNDGLFASDVIANAVGRWAPQLSFTTGASGTIKPTSFVIPQLEFRVPTTVAEVIKQANRFSLNDWAVEPGPRPGEPIFYYNERNTRGRKWRARVAPAKLQETGPQVDQLWNGVIVTFQDVDGSTKTVGPTGAPTDTTDASLLDTDPLNPINQLGLRRPAILDMGIVSTTAAATEVGRVFLERSKDLDQSGSAEIVGHVQDDKGITHPAWRIRAGDQISFIDSSDTSYRRIVKTSYDHDSRTNSIDLDSPPEGMDALLERLGASLFTAAMPKPVVLDRWGPGR